MIYPQRGLIVAVFAVSLFFSGCEGGSDSSSSTSSSPAPSPPQSLGESLKQLGVDTTDTPRLDSRGNPYPDSYSPLGNVLSMREIFVEEPASNDKLRGASAKTAMESDSKFVVGRAEELLLVGYRTTDNGDGVVSVVDDFSIADADVGTGRLVRPAVLSEQSSIDAPWALEELDPTVPAWVVPGTHRAATAADVNGNGFRESVIAYVLDDDSGDQVSIHLRVSGGIMPAATTIDVAIPVDLRYFPVFDLRIAAGDFDSDGVDEIALVVSRKPLPGMMSTPVGIYLIEGESDGYIVDQEQHLNYTSALNEPYVTMVIEAAQLDHDGFSELVLILNENLANGSPPGTFASQYFVFSVANSDMTLESAGPVTATVDNGDGTETVHTAVVADVAAGDIDGDAVDELVFGGLEEVTDICHGNFDPITGNQGQKNLLFVLGNIYNDFEQVGALPYSNVPFGCQETSSFGLRFTHVNTLDFDGDGDTDIQINQFVFEGPVEGEFAVAPISIIGTTELMTADGSGRYYDRANSVITVSDQTGDGIDDLITLLLARDQDPNISVFSYNPNNNGTLRPFEMPLLTEDIQGGVLINPIIVPVDVDNDNVSILRYTGEHFLDFTEPVILAVLAAAPCIRDIGQNIGDSCSTSWGSAQTGAAGRSFNISVNGSVGVGVGAAGAGVSTKSLVVLSLKASREISATYELSLSRTFSTGPFEDGVVFTSIPMDRFVYRKIVAKLPDDGPVNETLMVNLPRGPDMRLVTRQYYNSSLVDDPDNPPLMIGDEVFQHTPGDVTSYPTAQEKDQILAESQTIVNQRRRATLTRRFDPINALRGLEVGPIAVGEGGGSSELGLEYTETFGQANALEVGVEFQAETLAGAAANMSIGLSAERVLQVSHGDTTLFAGSVGSIPADFYAANQYQFGLFAYLVAIDDVEFEVINYWVEF